MARFLFKHKVLPPSADFVKVFSLDKEVYEANKMVDIPNGIDGVYRDMGPEIIKPHMNGFKTDGLANPAYD